MAMDSGGSGGNPPVNADGTSESFCAEAQRTHEAHAFAEVPNGEHMAAGRLSTDEQLREELHALEDLERVSTVNADDEQEIIDKAKDLLTSVARKQRTLEDIVSGSPFLDYDSPVTAYEWFKLIVLLPWTFMRFILLIICIIPTWIVVSLLVLGMDRNEPFGRKRALAVRWILRFWASVLLKVFYHFWHIKVTGRENLKEAGERSIIVINHVSYMDPIVMVALFAPSSVAKAGVAKLPFFGAFAVALQSLFVERKGFDVANSKTVRKGGAQLVSERAADPRYPLVMVAPEGTTKPMHCMLHFSTGAFVAGQPVTPVLLKYTGNTCFNPGWGLAGPGWHIWRLMHQFYNKLEVEVCPMYVPSDSERSDARLYADNVRAWMAHRMGCPMVDHGIAELMCLYEAKVDTHWLGRKVNKPDGCEHIYPSKLQDAKTSTQQQQQQQDGSGGSAINGHVDGTLVDGAGQLAANGGKPPLLGAAPQEQQHVELPVSSGAPNAAENV